MLSAAPPGFLTAARVGPPSAQDITNDKLARKPIPPKAATNPGWEARRPHRNPGWEAPRPPFRQRRELGPLATTKNTKATALHNTGGGLQWVGQSGEANLKPDQELLAGSL